MSHRLRIIVVIGVVLFGCAAGTYYWAALPSLEQHRPEASEHLVFKYLDASCREKYGEAYGFRTNKCCETATSDTCAPL
jgi:hypothetical protein